MIIDLRAIPREGARRFEFSLDKDWWRPSGQNDRVLALKTPLIVKVEIFRTGDKYVLSGDLEGSIQVMCDRCLEYYQREVRADFRLFLVLKPDVEKAEIELLEEDMEVDFIRGEEIDLDAIIQEQLYLSLPIKSLCREGCLGLCPKCGSNLNNGACHCEGEQGHPGLSKLESLIIEGE
jgi:uncharacterized protein